MKRYDENGVRVDGPLDTLVDWLLYGFGAVVLLLIGWALWYFGWI